MKNKFILGAALCLGLASCQQQGGIESVNTNVKLNNSLDSCSYAIGANLGMQISQDLSELDLNLFMAGLKTAFGDTSSLLIKNPMEIQMAIRGYMLEKQQKLAQANKEAGEAFLAEIAKKEGVKSQTVTGRDNNQYTFYYEVIQEGEGAQPTADDTVECLYTGSTIDGKVFDSTADRNNQPTKFPLRGVIQGWTEGIPLMKVGSKYKFYFPSELAYGPQGNRSIEPNATLIFDVELVSIEVQDKPAHQQ